MDVIILVAFSSSLSNFCMSTRLKNSALSLVFFLCLAVHAVSLDQLTFATWNVENLFDTVSNQPKGADEEFTPESWRRWTPERYEVKLDNLAWVIDKMKPDILCLSEVENLDVLKALTDRIKKNYGWTFNYIGHVDSPDPRGIDNAVLSRYPIMSTTLSGNFGRRGTLIVTVDVEGSTVVVMANHLKSQMGDMQENIVTRTGEAMNIRKEALKILKQNPNASLMIAGDFNEDLDGASVTKGLGVSPERSESLTSPTKSLVFFNLVGDIPTGKRGSYYYARRKVWNTFDSIIIPPSMLLPLNQSGPDWRAQEAKSGVTKTFILPEMREPEDGRPKAYRRVRIKDKPANYYVEGYSDHFPVITVFRRGKSENTKGKR